MFARLLSAENEANRIDLPVSAISIVDLGFLLPKGAIRIEFMLRV